MDLFGEPICCAPTGDRCGEGVVWHPEEQAVYWTDINRFLIHRFDPANGAVKSWLFDEPVTAVLLTDREGTFAVLLGSRVIFWQPGSDARRDQGFRLGDWPKSRMNDAAVDPRGSIWGGSMQNNVNPDGSEAPIDARTGALYRIDPDGGTRAFQDHIGISNTLLWSPDRKIFYFGDTLDNAIRAHDYDQATGAIGEPQEWFAGFTRGLPDGSAIDEEGYVWNCRWGGSCIVRVSPRGQVDRAIEMPTRNITNCTFGGEDMKTLYVTTAASAEDAGDRLAGSLFAIRTSVRGVPDGRFRIGT
jgi:sugar lactone lactonase YvrE